MGLKCLDLYCGLGGFSRGFYFAGFNVLGVEINRDIAKKYPYEVICQDVQTLEGKHFKDFAIGIGGFYYKQVTNDEENGEKFMDGTKGQAFAIGPVFKYDYKKMSFTLKYYEELAVKNRADGGTFWFKFVYTF